MSSRVVQNLVLALGCFALYWYGSLLFLRDFIRPLPLYAVRVGLLFAAARFAFRAARERDALPSGRLATGAVVLIAAVIAIAVLALDAGNEGGYELHIGWASILVAVFLGGSAAIMVRMRHLAGALHPGPWGERQWWLLTVQVLALWLFGANSQWFSFALYAVSRGDLYHLYGRLATGLFGYIAVSAWFALPLKGGDTKDEEPATSLRE